MSTSSTPQNSTLLVVRLASASSILALLFGGFARCLPPLCAPIYILSGVCAIVPLCFGWWKYRLFGCLALCAALALTIYEYREGGKMWVVVVQADMQAIRTQLNAYNAANGSYPSTQQGLAALVAKPSSSPIPSHWTALLDLVPKDPWENDYVYRQPGRVQPTYDLFSSGPDHRIDTADDVWIK